MKFWERCAVVGSRFFYKSTKGFPMLEEAYHSYLIVEVAHTHVTVWYIITRITAS